MTLTLTLTLEGEDWFEGNGKDANVVVILEDGDGVNVVDVCGNCD